MPRRRGHTKATRKSGGMIWTANVFNELDPLATNTGVALVAAADIAPFKGLVMQTIRGWIHVAPITGSVLDDTLWMFIGKVDEDTGLTSSTLLPDVADTYVDEDIVWTGGAVTTHGVGTVVGGAGHWFDVHVKVKRKIRDGQELRLNFANNQGTGEQLLSGVLRTLLTPD